MRSGQGNRMVEKIDLKYHRNAEIVERELDDVVFLASPNGKSVYHLNVTGAAVWRLMAEPTSVSEACNLLHQAFPNVARSDIEEDISQVVTDLANKGFIARNG